MVLREGGGADNCVSDMKCFLFAPLFWGEEDLGSYLDPPCVADHKCADWVVALGEGAGEKHRWDGHRAIGPRSRASRGLQRRRTLLARHRVGGAGAVMEEGLPCVTCSFLLC